MKLIDMTCPHCNAQLKVDVDNSQAICEHCGATILIDDEVRHIQYDNAEEAGYKFEKGRQRARAEAGVGNTVSKAYQEETKKKRKTWLWVLGWIIIFPVPLTILMLRKKDMKPVVKYGIIAATWIVYFLIGFVGGNSSNETTTQVTDETAFVEAEDENSDVNRYNSVEQCFEELQTNNTSTSWREFSEQIEELTKKYGLYQDSKNTGLGVMYVKIAASPIEAQIISNEDLDKGTYYIRIVTDYTKGSPDIQLIDNRDSSE